MKPLRLLLLTVLVLLSTSSFASSPVKILVIHSYTQEYPWTRSQHDAFTATLVEDSDRDVLINTEYLDTKRRRYDAFYGEMFYAYLKDKYIDYIPDIIYTTDDNALTFALEYFNELFADTPIIFSGVNDYSVMDRLDETRVTGVFEKKEISPNLSFLQDINPGIKEILLIGDGSNTYQAIENEIRAELINYPDIQASFLSHHYIENLKAELVKKSEIYIFLTTLGGIVDKHEHVQSLEEIISAITDSGEHIILSMEDAYLYKGVLGGYVTSGKSQGATAARLALDILHNKPVAQIPVITKSPNEYIFDHNELARHALALPVALLEKATVLNQPPSFYERNRILILGSIVTLVSLLLVSMLVFLIILSRKNQKILAAASTTRDLAASLNEYSRQLENEKRKLNQAQTIAHIGNYTWEIADNVTTWSDELFRIVGKDRTTFTPSYEGYLACIHPEDRNNFVALTRNVTKNLGHYTGDYRILRSNGEVRHVHEEGEAVLNSNGNMVGLVGVIQDITDRTHAEAEQDRLQRELAQARKMEALGKLTGGIAHDFNNMLGIIIGYTELLKERYQSDCEPTMRSYLENIEHASNRARELVSKMMVFSRSDVRENKPLHLDIALRDTVEMLRSIIPSSIEINLNCEDQLPRVIMDSVQLQQIMMNLCLNAKDAMNGKGKLDIRLGWYRALN
ncbi:MAG: PAS domain S-box protein, partial [Gammaproteobacteria bacterium]